MWIWCYVVLWIYSKEMYVDLGVGSSMDLLQGSVCGSRLRYSMDFLRGSLCGSRPTKFMWI